MLAPIEIDPDTFLRKYYTLPALPEVVGRIQSLIQTGKVGVEKVAALISKDAATHRQVLKVVNSAYYGPPKEITNVRFAVAFVGLYDIYCIVLTLSIINTLTTDAREEVNRFWFHSFYTALCAKCLAKKYEPHLLNARLFLAAMLHDIGKLVYLKFFPDHYKALSSFCMEHGCLFNEAERLFSLPSSAFLGTLLCDHWRLQDEIKWAREFHSLRDLSDAEGNSPTTRFGRIICLANVLATLSTEQFNNALRREIAHTTATALGCTEPEFWSMMSDIYELRIDVENFMDQFHSNNLK
jgi:HD-like signal output (HDOD) protein